MIVGLIIGFSVASNVFLCLEIKRLNKAVDNLHKYIENEFEEEEEDAVTWQSTN